MNKYIKEYTRDQLISFMNFMITFEGNLKGKYVRGIALTKLYENEEWEPMTTREIDNLIDYYLDYCYKQ